MNKKSVKKSVVFNIDMLNNIEKIALKKGTTFSEVVREYIDKGLLIDGYSQDIDFITGIIRQELTSIYRLEDIKEILDKQTNRLAKMMMKIGKMSTGQLFLLINMFLRMIDEAEEDRFDDLLEMSIRNGINYMQKKDFQINDFLQDTENLKNISKDL